MVHPKLCVNRLFGSTVWLALILGISSIPALVSPIPAVAAQATTHLSVSVSLSPTTVNVQVGSSHSFIATVHNDSLNKGVKWTLSGPGKISSTFSKSGQAIEYTAPSTEPKPDTITLTATSVADHSKSLSAKITVTPVPPPAPIDLGTLNTPLIAVDRNNRIDFAALSAARDSVIFRHSTDDGRSFSHPHTVATSATPLAGLQMALDAQGHITVLWEDWQNQHAFVSVSSDGVSFSTPVIVPGAGINCGLGPCTTDRGIYPHLSVTPSGAINVASIGTVSDPNADVISTRSVDGGLHFSGGVDVAFAATGVTSAAGPQDQDYLIWSSPDGTVNLTASLDGGKTFGPVVPIASTFASSLDLFVEPGGAVDVTWRQGIDASMNGHTNSLMLSRSADQGQTFSTPLAVFTTTEFVIPDHQQLATEKSGDIDIVANANDGENEGPILFARSKDHGTTFLTQTLNSNGGFPSIGIDSCGGIEVAWDGTLSLVTNDIFLTLSTNGTTFSTPTNVSHDHANQTSFVPQIATDSRDHTFVIWDSNQVFFRVAGTCHP